MKLLQSRRLSLAGIPLLILALLFLPGLVRAQEVVTVPLNPMGGSGVSGNATLTAVGEGTEVTLDLQGLAPNAVAQATMQAGTCDMPSASFAALPELTADASGNATATGSILFRGTDDVALTTMADGEHIISIQAAGQVVACGVIPIWAAVSGPSALPPTGGVVSPLTAATLSILGLCVLSVGLFLRRRSLRY